MITYLFAIYAPIIAGIKILIGIYLTYLTIKYLHLKIQEIEDRRRREDEERRY